MMSQEYSLQDIKRAMNPVDYYNALTDRHGWKAIFENSFNKDAIFINTPYLKVLEEQFYANISRLEASEFANESNAYAQSINRLFESLENKLRMFEFQKGEGANLRGRSNLLKEITDAISTIRTRLDEYVNFSQVWIAKIEGIATYFNARSSKYVNLLTLGQNLSVDYPRFSIRDVSNTFTDEVAKTQEVRDQSLDRLEAMLDLYEFQTN